MYYLDERITLEEFLYFTCFFTFVPIHKLFKCII